LIVLTIVVCVMFPGYAKWAAGALGVVYLGFALLAFFSNRMLTGVALLLLIGVGWINLNQIREGTPVSDNSAKNAEKAVTGASSKASALAYLCWLDQKGIPATRIPQQKTSCGARPEHLPPVGTPYPVFIIAAEGGGIYAASAAATFLAELEDCVPGFARHIFA